jgi:hypothetical protein
MFAIKKVKSIIDTTLINYVIKTHLKSQFNEKDAYTMRIKKSLDFPLIDFGVIFIYQINST